VDRAPARLVGTMEVWLEPMLDGTLLQLLSCGPGPARRHAASAAAEP